MSRVEQMEMKGYHPVGGKPEIFQKDLFFWVGSKPKRDKLIAACYRPKSIKALTDELMLPRPTIDRWCRELAKMGVFSKDLVDNTNYYQLTQFGEAFAKEL